MYFRGTGVKGQILREAGEQRQYWGTENIRKQIFDFWGTGEQANLFQGNKGAGTPSPPGRASYVCMCHTYTQIEGVSYIQTD